MPKIRPPLLPGRALKVKVGWSNQLLCDSQLRLSLAATIIFTWANNNHFAATYWVGTKTDIMNSLIESSASTQRDAKKTWALMEPKNAQNRIENYSLIRLFRIQHSLFAILKARMRAEF